MTGQRDQEMRQSEPLAPKDSVSGKSGLMSPDRLASLAATNLMDSPHEEVFDRAVRLATRLTGRPVGLVSLVDETRQFFKAQLGLQEPYASARETPLSHSFCKYVVDDDQPLVVEDARVHPQLYDNLAIEDLDVVAYLGVPVRSVDGQALGSFCVIDNKPHKWSAEDLEVLEDIAALIETELRLRATVSEREILIDEMNHRLKNIFTLIDGMVRQSARSAEDAASMAADISGRLRALSAAHSLILPDFDTGSADASHPQLRTLVETILAPYPNAQIKIEGGDVELGPKAAVAFALSLHELATNAAKYGAFRDALGQLHLKWNTLKETVSLTWQEDLPAELQTDLTDTGFGSRLLQMNIEAQLGGKLHRELTPRGVKVAMDVPITSLLH